MIDPDGIMITTAKADNEIKLGLIPECDFETYNLDDDKGFKIYMSDIEKEVRGSFEYKQFIKFARDNLGMNRCAILQNAITTETHSIRIEIHHYPFTLYDICQIVFNKRSYYKESLELEMVAKEVMELHYKAMVGLIPLSETVHDLVHSAKLFIPIQSVFGRYDLFMIYYDPFISAEQKDVIHRIEKYSMEQTSDLLNTSILDANNLTLKVIDPKYQIPDMNGVGQVLLDRVQTIKDNGYTLPTVHDRILIEDKKERKPITCPIYLIDEKES